jgi:hypothetical protein
VITATTVQAALAVLGFGSVKLVVVGHLYSTSEKNAIANRAHNLCVKVLCMHSEPEPPEVAADAFIFNLDPPEHLLYSVASLLDGQQ